MAASFLNLSACVDFFLLSRSTVYSFRAEIDDDFSYFFINKKYSNFHKSEMPKTYNGSYPANWSISSFRGSSRSGIVFLLLPPPPIVGQAGLELFSSIIKPGYLFYEMNTSQDVGFGDK